MGHRPPGRWRERIRASIDGRRPREDERARRREAPSTCRRGFYGENPRGALDRHFPTPMLTWALKKVLGTSHEREIKRLQPQVEAINELEPTITKLTDAELKAKTAEFKEKLDNGATLDDILVEAFAVCREAGKRVAQDAPLRRAAHRRHGPPQGHASPRCAPARARRSSRRSPCYLNALEGKGVHVVTVNDYLATPRRRVDGQALRLPRPVDRRRRQLAGRAREEATPTAPTSPTARTTSSASTTCATT